MSRFVESSLRGLAVMGLKEQIGVGEKVIEKTIITHFEFRD